MKVKPDAAIVDMDGTLVDVSSIRHHIKAGLQPDGTYKKGKDFKAFHSESVNCPPIPITLEWVEMYRQMGLKIIIVTARSEDFKHHTDWWLALNNISVDAVFMRPHGDFRPDYQVKKDLLVRIRSRFNPIVAVDDNPNVIRLWEEEGISTTVIPGWEEIA